MNMSTSMTEGRTRHPADVVRRLFEIFDGQQWDRLDEIVTDDVRLEFGGEPHFGIPAIRAWQEQVYAALPDCIHHLENIVADAESEQVAVQIRVTATHRGGFPSAGFGTLPATGRRVEWTAGSFGRIRDGKICAWTAYSDSLVVLDQLGLRFEPVASRSS